MPSAGGAFSQASILALGIMPYISASIFMQLMTILIPQMQKVQKEGASGQKKINQWTRYLTVVVTFVQAYAYVTYLKGLGKDAIVDSFSAYFWLTTPIVLTAGTLFVMWLGEKITDKGLGNGTSLIIMVGILARLPRSFVQEWNAKLAKGTGGILIFVIEIAVLDCYHHGTDHSDPGCAQSAGAIMQNRSSAIASLEVHVSSCR